ncbi:MAG: alpha/beta hydrolase [Rhodospirillales bacterium]|jgi:arylformamidase
MTLVYRHYDQDTLDRECNPSLVIPDADAYLTLYAELSRRTRAARPPLLTASYGEGPLRTLDVFAAGGRGGGAGAPVHIFVHGGGWRMLTRAESSYVADGLCDAGIVVVAISYPLLPDATLDGIAADVSASLLWVRDHARDLGGDPGRIHVSGHSAGAHLAAMAVCDQGRGLPSGLIRSAVLLSGNYELEPLRLSARNLVLKLDHAAVSRNSPARMVPGAGTHVVVGWGERESGQYRAQGRELAAAWRAHGAACTELELPDLNHLEVPLALGRPDSAVAALCRRMALG